MAAVPNDSQEQSPLEQILAQVKDIAVLPQVVFKILESTGSTDTSVLDLEKDIQVDPGFSAKVLQMANSAYFALPRRITTIRDGVQYLGFKTVRQIAMTAGVFDLFVGKNDKESLRRRAWWRHSLDTANCAKWLCTHYKELNPEEAYTAGVLHLIGRTIMDRYSPEKYTVVMAGIEQGIPVVFAEQHFIGTDHAKVVTAVCATWGLPEELISAVDYTTPTPDGTGPSARACVAIANKISELATNGRPEGLDLKEYFPRWASDSLNITDNLHDWVEAGITVIAATARSN